MDRSKKRPSTLAKEMERLRVQRIAREEFRKFPTRREQRSYERYVRRLRSKRR